MHKYFKMYLLRTVHICYGFYDIDNLKDWNLDIFFSSRVFLYMHVWRKSHEDGLKVSKHVRLLVDCVWKCIFWYLCISWFRTLSPCCGCCMLSSGWSPPPGSEFYMPTFRNTLVHIHRQVGMKNDWDWEMLGYLYGKRFGLKIAQSFFIPTRLWRWNRVFRNVVI